MEESSLIQLTQHGFPYATLTIRGVMHSVSQKHLLPSGFFFSFFATVRIVVDKILKGVNF